MRTPQEHLASLNAAASVHEQLAYISALMWEKDRATVRRDIAARLLERMAVFSDITTGEAVSRSIEWTDALLAALDGQP